jgi:hypothetical protein
MKTVRNILKSKNVGKNTSEWIVLEGTSQPLYLKEGESIEQAEKRGKKLMNDRNRI